MNTPKFIWNGPEESPATILLAHGAGAAMDTPFMQTIAQGLAEAGLRVGRFEFPYMARRRLDGKRRPPDRQPVLLECWHAAIAAAGPADRLVIGGKSMGGRMASLIGDQAQVRGLICLGYPFHPPGRPERLRTDHLEALSTPTLICQGERDSMGNRAEVERYDLSDAIRLCWLADGDHSFKPRKASGTTEQANLAAAVAAIGEYVIYITDYRSD